MIESSVKSGRENDSSECFKRAILLGSFPARAELALLCFNQDLPHAECLKAFDLVKEGHEFGCPNCTGMLACFNAPGFRRRVIPRCDETAYQLACASADAGSWFGKMALAHFLKSLLGPIDPREDTFNVLWTHRFIRNFNSPAADVPAADVPSIEEVPIVENSSADEDDPFKGWTESDLEDWFGIDYNILMDFQIQRIVEFLIKEIQQEHACNPNIPKVWLNLPAL